MNKTVLMALLKDVPSYAEVNISTETSISVISAGKEFHVEMVFDGSIAVDIIDEGGYACSASFDDMLDIETLKVQLEIARAHARAAYNNGMGRLEQQSYDNGVVRLEKLVEKASKGG